MTHHFTASQGAMWVQVDGPNTQPRFLGCHQIGDVDKPYGDIELIQCPDPAGIDRFKTVGSIQGAAGSITTSITTDVTDELDWLEQIGCQFTLFVHMIKGGRRDVFTNFDRTFVLPNCTITNEGLSNLSARTADDNARSEQTFDLSSEELLRLFEQTISRQSITESNSISDITFCNARQCRTDQQVSRASCEIGFAVSTSSATTYSVPFSILISATQSSIDAVAASVISTTNGATWTETESDPFDPGEDAYGIECFELSRNTTRVIVARGTTDEDNPAEIAYTDDDGATWTNIDVGEVDGQYAPTRFSLFALDRNSIWIGTQNGYVYYSNDGSLTWTAQQSGGITSGAINAIRFVDENIGWFGAAGNIVARTLDGGTSWSALSGPSAQSGVAITVVEPLDRNRCWIGYADGDLYYTQDGGINWTARSFTGSGVGSVRDIVFMNETLGYLLSNNASNLGTVQWSIDGGYTWTALTTTVNSGLNTLSICNPWNFYVAGERHSYTGVILKGTV